MASTARDLAKRTNTLLSPFGLEEEDEEELETAFLAFTIEDLPSVGVRRDELWRKMRVTTTGVNDLLNIFKNKAFDNSHTHC